MMLVFLLLYASVLYTTDGEMAQNAPDDFEIDGNCADTPSHD